MHWESQSGRYPRDPRLGHRPGRSYSPSAPTQSILKDLVSTNDGFISLDSSSSNSLDTSKKLVIITGGSVAMGLGASRNEKTISSQLQILLDTYFPNEFCVVNSACAAYCSWQEFIRYSMELSWMKPSITVSIGSWNDFIHSSIGNRYTGRWYRNHDRSIDDLSESLFGLDESVSIRKLLLQYLSKNDFTRAITKAFYSVIGSKSLTDSEIKWGYHMAKFTYKSNAVANYVHNMRQLNAVASLYNGYFLSVVQPWITQDVNNSSQSTSDLLRYASVNRGFLHTRDQFYLDLESELDPSFMVKSPEFEANDFVDHCHLADCGQLKLAKFVFSQLFPNEH